MFAQRTSEISSWTLEDKIRIHARACNILCFHLVEYQSPPYKLGHHWGTLKSRGLLHLNQKTIKQNISDRWQTLFSNLLPQNLSLSQLWGQKMIIIMLENVDPISKGRLSMQCKLLFIFRHSITTQRRDSLVKEKGAAFYLLRGVNCRSWPHYATLVSLIPYEKDESALWRFQGGGEGKTGGLKLPRVVKSKVNALRIVTVPLSF